MNINGKYHQFAIQAVSECDWYARKAVKLNFEYIFDGDSISLFSHKLA